eukprot:3532822-Rhodomonas_salina.2
MALAHSWMRSEAWMPMMCTPSTCPYTTLSTACAVPRVQYRVCSTACAVPCAPRPVQQPSASQSCARTAPDNALPSVCTQPLVQHRQYRVHPAPYSMSDPCAHRPVHH